MSDADPADGQVFLAAGLASVGLVRQRVSRTCSRLGLDDDACSDATLLASEVVTNALTHGRSEARVVVTPVEHGVLVEVSDDNSRHPASARHDVDALDGRGLDILGRLSSRWGVRDEAVGKTVWFEVQAQTGPR